MTTMNSSVAQRARDFLENERQFHLGFLPTEQSNPKTKNLDRTFAKSTADGVAALLAVDRDIVPMAERVFTSAEFEKMEDAMLKALSGSGRIVFSGCGATGRLSLLLESLWRHHAPGKIRDRVRSIMTGGDYALIRSVESFEDYAEFGRQQVRELALGKDDVLVAITEGGETSSVLGTVEEAARRDCAVFLLFNNPAKLLREHLDRCREAIDNPKVSVLDLHCGPMAVTGSTRMQATTSEQLVAGAALENALERWSGGTPRRNWAQAFNALLDELAKPSARNAMARQIEQEETLYRKGGLVTYYASQLLIDLLTDTTERSPTFMLPPFKRSDDKISPPSWAFVKNPLLRSDDAWTEALGRKPSCLPWTVQDYKRMGASEKIQDNPPKISNADLAHFEIGCEKDGARLSDKGNAAFLICTAGELKTLRPAFEKLASDYAAKGVLVLGAPSPEDTINALPCEVEHSKLGLLERLAAKLTLNCISTGTMARLGRITGNWMSFVDVSNKKLIDRSIRLIAELCELDYETACRELFKTLDLLERETKPGAMRMSPVQHALARLKG